MYKEFDPDPARLALSDQHRAAARDLLREAPCFFVALSEGEDHYSIAEFSGEKESVTAFLFASVATLWEALVEVTRESDAELMRKLRLALTVLRVSEEGGTSGF